MSAETQCQYMAAAYPMLDAEESCSEHRHDEPTFALARALAMACQDPDPSDEQIGWLLDDAAAVVDDFAPTPNPWVVTEPVLTDEVGLTFLLQINGLDYCIPDSEWEPAHPVLLARWRTEREEADQ